MHAITCEELANGLERGEYSLKWLRSILCESLAITSR
jgi:hypothetical protein